MLASVSKTSVAAGNQYFACYKARYKRYNAASITECGSSFTHTHRRTVATKLIREEPT